MSNSKKIILIDLDHTLFNTQEFRKVLNLPDKQVNYRSFLYNDALPFIKYVSKYGTPVLFTEGDMDFQNQKIEKSGLKKVFGRDIKVFPACGKARNNALTDDQELIGRVLIDDKPEVLDKAISLGYKTIRVRRGKYKLLNGRMRPDYVVSDLKSIIKKDLFKKLLNV